MRGVLASLVVPLLAALALPAATRWLRTAGVRDGAARVAVAGGLALAWVSVGATWLSFAHALFPAAIGAWIAAGAALSLAWGERAPLRVRPSLPLLAGALAAAALAAIAALPPWDRDELVYHLALPRLFARAHGFAPTDDNVFASFPLGWEMIEAALHAFGVGPDKYAPFPPRLVGTWAAVTGALAVAALARALGAGRGAWLAALLLLAVPSYVEVGSSAYVEPWLVACATLATFAATLAVRGRAGAHALAGVFTGAAVGSKYPALAFGVAVAAVLAIDVARRPTEERRAAAARFATFAAIAAAMAAPFLVRNVIERGNPVFPLAYGLFGGRGWDDTRAAAYWITLRQYGAGDTDWEALLVPVRVFFWRDFLHGFEGSIGPVPALGIAAGAWLALGRGARPGFRAPAGVALALATAWSVQYAFSVAQARFYLVATSLWLALLAAGVARLRAPARRLARVSLLVAALAWGAEGYAHVWTRQPTLAWWRGQTDDRGVLAETLPQSFVPLRELEAWVPETGKVWLVWMRGYTYYLRRDARFDCVFEEWRFDEQLEAAPSAAAFAARLAGEGVTHVLANERLFLRGAGIETSPGRGDRLRARWREALATGVARPVHAWGAVTLYAIEPAPRR